MQLAEVFIALGMSVDKPSFRRAFDEVKAQANEIQKYWKNLEREQFGPKAPSWHKSAPMFDAKEFVAQWSAPIKQAEAAATSAATNVASTLKGIGAAAAIAQEAVAVLEQIASAAIGAARALASMVEGAADAGIKINKLSAQLGISKRSVQEWSYVAEQAGSSIQQFGVGLRMFERNLFGTEHGGKNRQFKVALDEVGISASEAAKILNSPDGINEALFRVADRIKLLKEQGKDGEVAALGQKLFGARASEMIADLSQGGDKLREMVQRAHELGAVLSDEQVGNLKGLHNAIDDIKISFSAMVNTVVADVAPAITAALHEFTSWVGAHREQIKELLEFALHKVVEVASVVGHYLAIGFGWVIDHRDVIERTIESIASMIVAWVKMMAPLFAVVGAQIMGWVAAIGVAAEEFAILYEAAADVVNDIVGEIERVENTIMAVAAAIAAPFQAAWDQVRGIFRKAKEDLESIVESMPGGSTLLNLVDGDKGGLAKGAARGIHDAKSAPRSSFDESMFFHAGAKGGHGAAPAHGGDVHVGATTVNIRIDGSKDPRATADEVRSGLAGQVDRMHRHAYAAVTGGS